MSTADHNAQKYAAGGSKYRLKNDTTGVDLRNAVFITQNRNEGLIQRVEGGDCDALGCWTLVYRYATKRAMARPCLEEHNVQTSGEVSNVVRV